jgi:RimJ/RimL family protein N-acetyltransferase
VAAPAAPDELRERLAGYAADFAAGRSFRYAMFAPSRSDDGTLLGGADLHPRSSTGRVSLAEADRVEVGYWLADSAEGHGYAVEAARALVGIAASISTFGHLEARIDPRNARSAALARRLGLHYGATEEGLDVWRLALESTRP